MAKIVIYNPNITSRRILEDSRVGLFLASTWARYMNDYVPMQEGILASNYTVKPFQIVYESPYAHYMYEGELYISPTTGSSWALPNEIKVPTGIPLNFSKEQHPLATSHWDVPAKQAYSDRVAKELTEYLKRI